MLNIVGRRYLYFAISLIIIIPGLIVLATNGLQLAIDFTGGSLLEVTFESGEAPLPGEIRELYAEFDYPDSLVQTSPNGDAIIRSKVILPAIVIVNHFFS